MTIFYSLKGIWYIAYDYRTQNTQDYMLKVRRYISNVVRKSNPLGEPWPHLRNFLQLRLYTYM